MGAAAMVFTRPVMKVRPKRARDEAISIVRSGREECYLQQENGAVRERQA